MQVGMSVIGCSFVYLALLAINYFKKERVKTFETKLYSVILVSNIIGLILEFICCITVSNIDFFGFINEIVNRAYLLYFITYITIFTVYVWYVSFSKATDNKDISNRRSRIRIFFAIIYSF